MQPNYMPLRRSEALRNGLVTRYSVDRDYVRIFPDVYIRREAEWNAVTLAHAAWCWSKGRGVLAGWSAAAFWGAKWIDTSAPAVVNLTDHRTTPANLVIYRDALAEEDVVVRRSCAITSPVRTAYDLGRRLDLDSAVEAVDMMYQCTRLTRTELAEYVDARSGDRGLRQIGKVVDLSDEGAESTWETKTRLAIVREGLPQPETQLEIHDANGRFIGRADMGWRCWRVVVEYEGDHHFDKLARNNDIERWNALEAAGWRVIRVKAKQLMFGRPLLMLQIRSVLRERGAQT
ncbi:DUF559 domain-containing protein [Antrihabitans stalagmiti]|nr:DUF559 domain-containing protein [Antrihabitans stalagmiti]